MERREVQDEQFCDFFVSAETGAFRECILKGQFRWNAARGEERDVTG